MSTFSFKKINFFRHKETEVKNHKNNGTLSDNGKEPSLINRFFTNPIPYVFIFSLTIAYFISYLPSRTLPVPGENDIATTDIIAPANMTIEDEETTETRRQEAVDAVLPVYSLDPNVFISTEENIRALFGAGRDFSETQLNAQKIDEFNRLSKEQFNFTIPVNDLRLLARLKFPATLEENLINLIGTISAAGIILTKNLFIHDENEKGLTVIFSPGNERSLRVADIPDINESKIRLTGEINPLGLPQEEKSLLIMLSHLFVAANITYNPIETSDREDEARRDQETIFYNIKKGKVIVRKGDEVSLEAVKQITAINQNLSAKPSWLTNFAGGFLLFFMLLLAKLVYLRTRVSQNDLLKRFLLNGSLLLLSLLFYKFFTFLASVLSQNTTVSLFAFGETYTNAYPLQLGTLLIAFFFGTHPALIFTIFNGIMAGFLLKSNFSILVFSIIGGFAAIWGTKHYGRQSRTTPLRAGLVMVAPINIIIIIIFHLVRETIGPYDRFFSELFMGALGGLLSGVLAFVFLPFFENLFGLVTRTRLLELTNSDLPIFRKMALEAPGSYHHSLIVASLAETAADEIGLDSLLVKAGALYHDIGKIKRPEYFIENRTRKSDMHKDLKPSMSTLVIINHVKEGLEQANKLKLPRKVKKIIEQHHGNSLVRFFFEKAKEEYDPDMHKVGEESYRYPGPKPDNKEAALVMLADSVEAASRSIQKPTKPNLKRAITEIFNNYLQDGQLDHCQLSLQELKSIAASFLNSLFMIYHPRIEYPGFNFAGQGKKPAAPQNK